MAPRSLGQARQLLVPVNALSLWYFLKVINEIPNGQRSFATYDHYRVWT